MRPTALLCLLRLSVCLGALLSLAGCKVPFTDIGGVFVLADATWFAEEETLFIFYEIQADQGLGPEAQIEVQFITDDGVIEWTPLSAFEMVHTHVPVDCGVNLLCGSASIHVPREPRAMQLQLRYHPDSALSREAPVRYNVVGPGPAHTHRSLLIYGVFTEDNRSVQWRARHRFPTVRNQEVERLGLRRTFRVADRRLLASAPWLNANPYRYGGTCPDSGDPVEDAPVETDERAIFDPLELPDAALTLPGVCARSTVTDATGEFTTFATARKNPEVRPAFPALRSPIRDAVRIPYVLAFCDRTISRPHLQMQRQRLLANGVTPICLDDWVAGDLSGELITRLRDDVDQVRAGGDDMVITLVLHHDERRLRTEIEAALAAVLEAEEARNSPRLAGAFVFDSYAHTVADAVVGRTTVWCPAQIDANVEEAEDLFNIGLSSLACAVPDPSIPVSLGLGPFDLGVLPILPTRARYLSFIDTFSDAQAGRVTDLVFRVPERPATAQHAQVPPFGSASFFNDEVISAEPDDAFSFCANEEYPGFVFRSPILEAMGVEAPDGQTTDMLPIESLPAWHAVAKEPSYALGIVWQFPYLLQLEYEIVASVSVSVFSATLPLGFGIGQTDELGSTLWAQETFPLARTLTQCTRFCGFPTFDSAGVYQVRQRFNPTYQSACYSPLYPMRPGTGFPLDP